MHTSISTSFLSFPKAESRRGSNKNTGFWEEVMSQHSLRERGHYSLSPRNLTEYNLYLHISSKRKSKADQTRVVMPTPPFRQIN